MINISPDTFFRWTGGCWSAVPTRQQGAEENTGASRHSPASTAIPFTQAMTPERASPESARERRDRGALRLRAAAGGK